MKRGKKIIIIVVAILAVLVIVTLINLQRPKHDNFGTLKKMRLDFVTALEKYDVKEREVNKFFNDYRIKVGFPSNIILDSKEMLILVKPWENKQLDNIVYSQFDLNPPKDDYMDFTFMLRPRPNYTAPFIHGDALIPLTGVKGLFHMDFYFFDPKKNDIDKFFGDQLPKVKKAFDLVQKYQKTTDRGKMTRHLEPFKSKYRLELKEPAKATAEEMKKYYQAVYDSFFLYLDAYLVAVSRQKPIKNKTIIEDNVKNMQKVVAILDVKDIAIQMGKFIFPKKDFDTYFLDAFWRVDLPGRKQPLK